MMWALQLAGMAVGFAICLRSHRSEPCRTAWDWFWFTVLVVVWVIPVAWWMIGTAEGLRLRFRRRPPVDTEGIIPQHVNCRCVVVPVAPPDPVDCPFGLDLAAPGSDRSVSVTARPNGDGTVSYRPTVGVDLPEGLFVVRGVVMFECSGCGEPKPWPGEIDEFELGNPGNMCGGSPRCCP